jgi:type IX secretion system PorP/SprF family membrane protein
MKLSAKILFLLTLVNPLQFWGQEENHLFLFEEQFQWTNPSTIGLKENTTLALLIDSQWLGIKDAPKQQSIIFTTYRNLRKLNLGGIIRNRSRFGEQNFQLLLQSAYSIDLTETTSLNLGIQILGDNYSTDYEYLKTVDGAPNDPLLQPQNRFIPNIGIGFILMKKNFWVQGSMPRLLDQYLVRKSPTVFLRNKLHFFSGIGTTFSTVQNLNSLKLSGYVHNLAFDNLTVQLNTAIGLRIGEILLGINSSKNMGVGFQFDQRNFLKIGYYFQFPFLTSSALNKPNHSLSLQFKLASKNAIN